MPLSTPMLEQIRSTLLRHGMVPEGARVAVAVSGGPDSVCLTLALRELGVPLAGLAHVNHALRGADSEQDQALVEELGGQLGLPVWVRSAPVAGDAGNLEQNARRARRAFFRELLEDGRAERIALGHTRDDQAETVLFRLLRGAGPAGLAGILPVTREGLIRPLLDVTRAEVLGFLEAHQAQWREDASNVDLKYARNRIRHRLLPTLERGWSPHLREHLARLADLAYHEERWRLPEVASAARSLFGRHADNGGDALECSASALASLPLALRRRVARWALEQVRGDLLGVDAHHIEAAISLAGAARGEGSVMLPGCRVVRSHDRVRWSAVEAAAAVRPKTRIAIPGQELAPDGKSLIRIDLVRDAGATGAYGTLSWNRLRGHPVELRGWQPGDRYHAVGDRHERKLTEMFGRARVPSWQRPFWPILLIGETIVWTRQFGPARDFAASAGDEPQVRVQELADGISEKLLG